MNLTITKEQILSGLQAVQNGQSGADADDSGAENNVSRQSSVT